MRSLLLIALFFVTGCMIGPDYHKPEMALPIVWKQQETQKSQKSDTKAASVTQEAWWKDFHDETLDALIAKGLDNNHDRKIAEARVLETRALRLNAASTLYPDISAGGTAERGNPGVLTQNKTLDLYQGNFDASFEIDLFGGNRRKVEAQDAMIGSRIATYQNTTITLVAEVVREYATLRELQNRYDITQKTAETQKQLAAFSKTKFDRGAASGLEVAQTEALYRATLSQLPLLARDATATIYRLTVLCSEENKEIITLLEKKGEIPATEHAPIVDAPAAVLSRRPDVAEAERTLAANTSLTAVAISELYPKITLSALFGWQNTSLLPGANLWSLASGIAMPLLNFGRIEGGIDAANARQQQAYHAYRKAVISAVADVETKLSDYAKDKEYADSIKAVLESNRTALTLARLRYEKGLASLIDTLDAENKVYSAENELLTAKASEMRAVAALQKAGGL